MSDEARFSQDGAFEEAARLNPTQPDRGEAAEIERIIAMIREIGIAHFREIILEDADDSTPPAAVTEAQIFAMAKHKATAILRQALARVIDPPPGSNNLREAIIIGYAIGFEGLPSMKEMGKKLGIGKAAISRPALEFIEFHGLEPSCYMKSRQHRETYRTANKRRRPDSR